MDRLTLARVDDILSKPFVTDKGLHHKYREAIWKLVEVRSYLTRKIDRVPSDPFMPLVAIPKELYDF